MPKKKRRSIEKANREQDLPDLPDRRALERVFRDITFDLGGGKQEETPLDRAQEVMYQAFEATGAEQVRLARRALDLCADCADAYVLLAEHARTIEEAQSLYEQGVAAGERALGKQAFEEHAGHFWGVMETRPYMRAREGLAQCLWEAGRREEAAGHYHEMLRLNPNDNQGIRWSLATLLLDLDRDEELRQLLKTYEDDASTPWAYTKALLAFRAGGEAPRADALLAQAAKANKHVPAYLLALKPLPRALPPYITVGGEDEAVSYAIDNRRAWLNTPGAVSWLRKKLKVPSPEPRRPRRPSWPQLKLELSRLPQERGEVWQVDALPRLAGGPGQPAEEAPWPVVIVSRASHELLATEFFDDPPKPGDLWHHLIDAMGSPQQGEPHRPAKIEVRQRSFQAAWKSKLRQIGVECVLADTLDAVDRIGERLPSLVAESVPKEPGAAAGNPEELLSLSQESAEVWQADIRALPMWITGEGQPYRPWTTMVVSRTHDLVLAHQVTAERPSADGLWGAVLDAIRKPAAGSPHRPGTIEVGSEEHYQALQPHLDRAGIACVALEQLERLDFVLEDMASHLGGPGEMPSLLEVPGVKPDQVGGFYAAAAEFYRRKPWRVVPGDTPIEIQCAKLQGGPWYAVVMGQSGVQQGLAVYEDLDALEAMIGGDDSEEENSRRMSALSLMYSEAFEMPIRDLDAAEKHGWPVAGPEAFPLVVRINPGRAVRPPLAWELELLEGCLRAIPDFLLEKKTASSKTVTVASGELTLRLGWLDSP